jgi:hypothetical protein
MAASWLRISDLFRSSTNSVCIVARVQSINLTQRTLILYDDDDYGTSSSVTLHVSLVNRRTPLNIQSPGQCIQIYGKVIRQAGDIIRVDAQLVRQLGTDFDINEYVKGLMLTRQYMAGINGSDVVVDRNINHVFRCYS